MIHSYPQPGDLVADAPIITTLPTVAPSATIQAIGGRAAEIVTTSYAGGH